MEKERLARAIERIEQAAEKIGSSGPAPQLDMALSAQFEADLESARVALEDRDRMIAKLQADSADIGRLKDEEINRLREQLQAAKDAGTGVSLAEYRALQHQYDQLKTSAKSTLAGLDRIIGNAEQASDGSNNG